MTLPRISSTYSGPTQQSFLGEEKDVSLLGVCVLWCTKWPACHQSAIHKGGQKNQHLMSIDNCQ